MPRRAHLIPLALVGLLLGGCGTAPSPPKADRSVCRAVIAALPASIGGVVVHRGDYDASWGSLSLRCGVPRPRGLSATSECLSVAGVDWFAPPGWYDDPSADVDLTTVSLTPRTELHVPAHDRGGPAAAALADLAPALRTHLRPAKRCQ